MKNKYSKQSIISIHDWTKYLPIKIALEEDVKSPIKQEMILSRIERFALDNPDLQCPWDYDQLKPRFWEQEVEPLRKYTDRELITPDLEGQIKVVNSMSFIDAIILLPAFRDLVYRLRTLFDIDNPLVLRNKLDLTDEQIAQTSSENPYRTAALMRTVDKFEEAQSLEEAIEYKSNFERKYFEKLILEAEKASTPKSKTTTSNTSSKKKKICIKIPNSMIGYVFDFILYGLDTGKLISLYSVEKGHKGRHWRDRLLDDSENVGYVPFLYYWSYYYLRNYHRDFKNKKIEEVIDELVWYGFPKTERTSDSELQKRYRKHFME